MAFSWFLIIVIIVGVFILIKLFHGRHKGHKLMTFVIVIFIIALIVSVYAVARLNNIDMTTAKGFMKGMKVYSVWVIGVLGKARVVTANVIGGVKTSTNSSNDSILGSVEKTLKGNPDITVNASHASAAVADASISGSVGNIINQTIQRIKPNTPKPIESYK